MGARPKICAVCKAEGARLGLRMPGPRSALAPGARGYGWACSAACLKALLARRAARLAGPEAAAEPAPDQGALL